MSGINVDDVITDPDMGSQRFSVIRQGASTDSHGRTLPPDPTLPATPAVGAVQPASGRTMAMNPELSNVSGVIEIWTQFRLEGPSDTTQADIILYKGRTYMVHSVQPWIEWGQGFIHATCTLYNLVGPSPTRRPTISDP